MSYTPAPGTPSPVPGAEGTGRREGTRRSVAPQPNDPQRKAGGFGIQRLQNRREFVESKEVRTSRWNIVADAEFSD